MTSASIPVRSGMRSNSVSVNSLHFGIVCGIAVVVSTLASDWIVGLAIFVLWGIWHYLPAEEGPPILALALSYQWTQVSAGVIYSALTGRLLSTTLWSDYRPMVLLGLGCLIALVAGLTMGLRMMQRSRETRSKPLFISIGWHGTVAAYLASIALIGTVNELAWQIPSLTQAILALISLRLALVFLMFRRLLRSRSPWGWVLLLLTSEILLGLTGYFAGFKDPMVLFGLALLEAFDRRKQEHWVALSLLACLMVFGGVLWLGVRTEYRKDFASDTEADMSRTGRIQRLGDLVSEDYSQRESDDLLSDVDFFVERLWAVYYPALAISRVPSVLAHEDGAIMWRAIQHVLTPRLFFPGKPNPISDSEMVRHYSGVWVAGPKEGASIAFGYAVESYVDFGVPWMFLPVFIYGILMGMAYKYFLGAIHCRELAVPIVTVMFWSCLYLFERSWLNILGLSGTYMIYLGGAGILMDRYLIRMPRRHGLIS